MMSGWQVLRQQALPGEGPEKGYEKFIHSNDLAAIVEKTQDEIQWLFNDGI